MRWGVQDRRSGVQSQNFYCFFSGLTCMLLAEAAGGAPIGNAGVPATLTLTMPRPPASSTNENFTSTAPAPVVITPVAVSAPLSCPGATVSLVLEIETL